MGLQTKSCCGAWSGLSGASGKQDSGFQMGWEGEGRHCRQGALRQYTLTVG